MIFNSIIVLSSIVSGSLALIAGFILKNKPPKKINWWYGYRTKQSMKNQEQWDFAQKLGAKNMIRFSLIPFLTTILGFFIDEKHVGWSIGIVAVSTIVWAFFSIYITETKLTSEFDHGNP